MLPGWVTYSKLLLDFSKRRTTPLRPCAYGQIDQYTRTILQAIRYYLLKMCVSSSIGIDIYNLFLVQYTSITSIEQKNWIYSWQPMLSREIIRSACHHDECCWKPAASSPIRLCGRIIRSYGLGPHHHRIYIMHKSDQKRYIWCQRFSLHDRVDNKLGQSIYTKATKTLDRSVRRD